MKVKRESEKSWLKVQQLKKKSAFKKGKSWFWSYHFMANRWGNNGNSDRLLSRALKSLQIVTAAMKLKEAYSLEEKQ